MSLINDLAEIRQLQGKEPLPSPHVIAGFEPGAPGVPDYIPFGEVDSPGGQVEDEFGLDEAPPPVAPASPLIPRRAPVPVAPVTQAPVPAIGNLFKLAVGDRLATWKGRDVMLSESEEKAIRAIVLKAIQREILADLALAGAKRTRRPKATQQAVSEAPKKRGRPRKVTP